MMNSFVKLGHILDDMIHTSYEYQKEKCCLVIWICKVNMSESQVGEST